MFKYLKNDKITKMIGKTKNIINDEMRENEINFLEAHLKIEKEIQSIYDNNNFSYQDLVNRKKHLTKFNNNIYNIMISFIFGFLSSVIFYAMESTIININIDNNDKFMILLFVFYIIIGFIVFYCIFKIAHQISSDDKLNTNEYELSIIEKELNKYEKGHNKNI